jgi:hypothetical protein
MLSPYGPNVQTFAPKAPAQQLHLLSLPPGRRPAVTSNYYGYSVDITVWTTTMGGNKSRAFMRKALAATKMSLARATAYWATHLRSRPIHTQSTEFLLGCIVV